MERKKVDFEKEENSINIKTLVELVSEALYTYSKTTSLSVSSVAVGDHISLRENMALNHLL